MHITNHYPMLIHWRVFDASDTLRWIGIQEGILRVGESTTWNPQGRQRVQIEFRRGGASGSLIVYPTVIQTNNNLSLSQDGKIVLKALRSRPLPRKLS